MHHLDFKDNKDTSWNSDLLDVSHHFSCEWEEDYINSLLKLSGELFWGWLS